MTRKRHIFILHKLHVFISLKVSSGQLELWRDVDPTGQTDRPYISRIVTIVTIVCTGSVCSRHKSNFEFAMLASLKVPSGQLPPPPRHRCLLAEKALSQLPLPCAYAEDGCDFTGVGVASSSSNNNLAFHEAKCPFQPAHCPSPFCGATMAIDK